MKKKSFVLVFAATASVSLLIQCEKEKDKTSSTSASIEVETIQEKEEVPQDDIRFTEFIFPKEKKDSVMTVFKEKYSKEEQYTILALNRLDEKNAWRADTLMIPSKIEKDFLIYSPFPKHLDELKEIHKIVFFSYPIQAYAAYENGTLLKWGPTSMGKKSAQTEKGLMFANWKKELATSTVNSSWKLPYNFNIHNQLGIGWHQYDLPAYPASHSCLRLLMDDAKWMYKFADQWILDQGGNKVKANGTPVIVFGDYNWEGQKPWKKLAKDQNATTYTVDQMNAKVQPFLDKIKEEQNKRLRVQADMDSLKMTNTSKLIAHTS